jgi:hypothetical protein
MSKTAVSGLLRRLDSFLFAWGKWQQLTSIASPSIGIRNSLTIDVFESLKELERFFVEARIALSRECDATAYLILTEKIPVLLFQEVDYLPNGAANLCSFDDPYRFSLESIELLRHAAVVQTKYELEQVKLALQHATGDQRLALLLGLNCGFYWSDIAELQPKHFDGSHITKARAKNKRGPSRVGSSPCSLQRPRSLWQKFHLPERNGKR